MVRVVNIKTANPPFGLPGDVYIGRHNSFYGFPASKWQNPDKTPITSDEIRKKVIDNYEAYLFSSGLINDIHELKDAQRLFCFCKPKPCHGDVLKKYIDKFNTKQKTLF
jgi:hypothetical protein